MIRDVQVTYLFSISLILHSPLVLAVMAWINVINVLSSYKSYYCLHLMYLRKLSVMFKHSYSVYC